MNHGPRAVARAAATDELVDATRPASASAAYDARMVTTGHGATSEGSCLPRSHDQARDVSAAMRGHHDQVDVLCAPEGT
jgi:hypothetical protein